MVSHFPCSAGIAGMCHQTWQEHLKMSACSLRAYHLTSSVLFLFVFCLLSVSWQQEGKPKGGVLNESCVPRSRAGSGTEGGLLWKETHIGTMPTSMSDLGPAWIHSIYTKPGPEKGSWRQCDHTEHALQTGRERRSVNRQSQLHS